MSQTRPKIGVDFHVVDDLFQGSRTYILELFSRVISISPDMEFFLFLENVDSLPRFSSAFSLPNVRLIYMRHTNPLKRLCWQLPRLQRKYALDFLHTQFISPVPSFSPCMVTIHDILFESHPQYFTPFFRLRSKFLVRLAALRSVHIFTVSEYSKQEIVSRYKVNPQKVTITFDGVDTERYFPGVSGKEIIEKRGLSSKGYILTVGRIERRKNHVNLLKAYAKLEAGAPPLVIVGQKVFGFETVFRLVHDLGLKDRVLFIHDVNDHELPALYRHARLFVYPSWAEGFGLPPLEAMASGVPVISSDTTAISEVVGEAGIFFDPGQVDEISYAMRRALSDDKLSETVQKAGVTRASLFHWDIAAKEMREEFIKHLNI